MFPTLWWHNNIKVPMRKAWGRVRGYNYCCAICGMPIKAPPKYKKRPWSKQPYWKYCPYCGDQIWYDEEELPSSNMGDPFDDPVSDAVAHGVPTLFGYMRKEYLAYSLSDSEDNLVEIYDCMYGKCVWSRAEPMHTSQLINMFCEEYEEGQL